VNINKVNLKNLRCRRFNAKWWSC